MRNQVRLCLEVIGYGNKEPIGFDLTECGIALEAKQSSNRTAFMAMINGKALFGISPSSCSFRFLTEATKTILQRKYSLVLAQTYSVFFPQHFFRVVSFSLLQVSLSPFTRSFTCFFRRCRSCFINILRVTRTTQSINASNSIWMATGRFFHA